MEMCKQRAELESSLSCINPVYFPYVPLHKVSCLYGSFSFRMQLLNEHLWVLLQSVLMAHRSVFWYLTYKCVYDHLFFKPWLLLVLLLWSGRWRHLSWTKLNWKTGTEKYKPRHIDRLTNTRHTDEDVQTGVQSDSRPQWLPHFRGNEWCFSSHAAHVLSSCGICRPAVYSCPLNTRPTSYLRSHCRLEALGSFSLCDPL